MVLGYPELVRSGHGIFGFRPLRGTVKAASLELAFSPRPEAGLRGKLDAVLVEL